MGLMLRKVGDEMRSFYDEVVIENGPRYRNPRQWLHLYVDLFVSAFAMSYTLGHIVAVALPVYGLFWLIGQFQ